MFELVIRRHAKSNGGSTAFSTPKRAITFAEMERNICSCYARTRGFELRRGDRVIINVSSTYVHWLLTFVIEAQGAVSIAVDHYIPLNNEMVQFLGAVLILTDQPIPDIENTRIVLLEDDWAKRTFSFRPQALPRPRRSAHDPVRIVLSSGTTGHLKKILLTREVIDRRIADGLEARVLVTERSRILSLVGERAIGGFMTGLSAWTLGAAVYSRDFSPNLADALTQLKINCIVAAPIHVENLLKTLPDGFEPTPGLVLYVGGGVLTKELASQVRRRLTSNIVISYGTTESGGISQGTLEDLDGAEDSAGFIAPYIDLQVVENADGHLPDGIGEIRVRGAGVVNGYLDDSEATAHWFKDGWYHPGDLGSIDQKGVLRIYGRRDDLMNFGGQKYLPSQIEDEVARRWPVHDVAAFSENGGALGSTLWIAYVADHAMDFPGLLKDKRIVIKTIRLDRIPRNALGKVERQKLREQFITVSQNAGGPIKSV